MRVLQIHNYYRAYGGECWVVDTERGLLENQGHEVHQFVRNSRSIAALPAIRKLVLATRIPHNPRVAARLTQKLQQLKPDVAHVHNLFPLLSPTVYRALAEAGVPTVQTHHNYRMLCPNALFYIAGRTCTRCRGGFHHAILRKCVRQSRLLSLLYALALHRARHRGLYARHISIHIALSRFFARQLTRAGIAADRIRICGHCVDGFADSGERREEYFLYLGRLSPEKGLTTLIEAVRLAGVRLKVAGTGPLADMLKARAARLDSGRVEFLGFVGGRRKDYLIRKSIAAVVPSECYETFGLTAAEALACGTPVIASRIGGLPEVVQDGVSGFLFTPGDAGDLANRLRQAWHERRLTRRMGIQALTQAKKQFSPQVHVRQLVNIYTEAIERFHAVAPHDL